MAKKTYDVNLPKFAAANDSAALVRGAVIANSLCGGCHGGDFAGTEFFKDDATGSIPAPNITSGGRTKNYTDADWLRIIRYGVKPDKHGAMIMPSKEMGTMSNEDIAALVGYLKTIPASNKTWPDPEFTLLSKVLAGAGFNIFSQRGLAVATDKWTMRFNNIGFRVKGQGMTFVSGLTPGLAFCFGPQAFAFGLRVPLIPARRPVGVMAILAQ